MKKNKEPRVPVERRETIRREILSLLKDNELSAKAISAEVGVSEKEVYEHLDHIRKSIGKGEHGFIINPAVCRKCGFLFRKRDRLRKPGRCPVCRSETIDEPLFSISATV
jgi:transcriptional regulator